MYISWKCLIVETIYCKKIIIWEILFEFEPRISRLFTFKGKYTTNGKLIERNDFLIKYSNFNYV